MSILLLLTFLLATPSSGPQTRSRTVPATRKSVPARQPAPGPAAVILDFNRWYVGELNTGREPMETRSATLRRYVTRRFLARIERESRSPHGLGADPFLDAQDWAREWARGPAITDLKVRGVMASATAVLRAKGWKDHRLQLKLRREGGWKLDSVASEL